MDKKKIGDLIGKILEYHTKLQINALYGSVIIEFLDVVRDFGKVIMILDKMRSIKYEILGNDKFKNTKTTIALKIGKLEPVKVEEENE